jgi:hypothetical protein
MIHAICKCGKDCDRVAYFVTVTPMQNFARYETDTKPFGEVGIAKSMVLCQNCFEAKIGSNPYENRAEKSTGEEGFECDHVKECKTHKKPECNIKQWNCPAYLRQMADDQQGLALKALIRCDELEDEIGRLRGDTR